MLPIDSRSARPIYEQIVDAVKADILAGALRAGEALPSIRQAALELRVNPNTVARAYQELEKQGVVESAQGRGVFVSQATPGYSHQEMYAWRGALRRLVAEMRFRGVPELEIAAMLDEQKKGRDDDA